MSQRKLNPHKQSLTVGDVARRSGVAVSTVHFYESRGLIESTRNAGNQRRFSRDVLRRVAVIKIAQRTGMPLAEIKASLDDLPTSRTPDTEDWRHLSEQWRSALDERIRCLVALRDQLDGCIGCGCLSLKSCPLRNPEDVLADTEAGGDSSSPLSTRMPGCYQ